MSLSWARSIQSIPPPSHVLNIILPSTSGSSKWSLSLRFSHQNLVYTSLLPIRAACSSHLTLLYFITRIFSEVYRSLRSSLCRFLHSPVTSYLIGPNTLLSTLFSNALSLRSSLNNPSCYYIGTEPMKIKFVWQILVPNPLLENVNFHWLGGRNVWKHKQERVTTSLLCVRLWHHTPVHKTACINISNVIKILNSVRLSCWFKRLTVTFGIQASVIL